MITFSGNRRQRDPRIIRAENVIFGTYGDVVRVREKNRDLLKFGSIGSTQGTSEQTIMEFQGTEIRETYATGNSVDSIVTTDNTFNGNVYIEGHTLASNTLTFVAQTVACNGNTPASLGTAIARATRANIPGSTGLASTSDIIYIYDSTVATSATGGTPSDATATKLIVNGVENQSEKCATSISGVDYWIVTSFYAGIEKKSGASATIRLRSRVIPNVFRTIAPKIHLDADSASEISISFDPYLIIPKNSDVELTVEGSASAIQVSGGINGYLAVVV